MTFPIDSARADEMTDDEILAAFAEADYPEAYARFALKVLRGRHDTEAMPVQ